MQMAARARVQRCLVERVAETLRASSHLTAGAQEALTREIAAAIEGVSSVFDRVAFIRSVMQ